MTAKIHARSENYIAGSWTEGLGQEMISYDPAYNTEIWRGRAATAAQVDKAVTAAKKATDSWALTSLESRLEILEKYKEILDANKAKLAQLIAQDAGKVLWDATGEATAMINKLAISIKAYYDRTPTRESVNGAIRTRLTHRPHGVMAVFGPYNFPGHLPNGHILPALIAGNTIVYKPSDLTPAVAAFMVEALVQAGLPEGVINLVQGGKDTGAALVDNKDIDGLLFTGSVRTGQFMAKQLLGRPGVIQALELGGNNPLIVHDVQDKDAAAAMTILSAFVSSGQRCTCARRLIVPVGQDGDAFIDNLVAMMDKISVGGWNYQASNSTEAFMGPVINKHSADHILQEHNALLAQGGKIIRPLERLEQGGAFLSAGLMDVTDLNVEDKEIFGPFLQLYRSDTFEQAIALANNTRFGLASGLLSDNKDHYEAFYPRAKAGIVNWNQQLTGAASTAPFGGIGLSGNHRPSAYYAADYSAYAVASMENADNKVALASLPVGIAQ